MSAPTLTYTLGLDLGQAADFTTTTVVERQWHAEADQRQFNVKQLKRYPLGTPYPDIVTAVTELASKEPLQSAKVVVDATGVGKPVVDMFRKGSLAGRIVAVKITGGHQVNKGDDGSWNVPKKELVAILQVLLGTKRLQIAKGLKYADTLVKEMLAFRCKVNVNGNESFEAWRERDHDDLVLAVALACWKAVQGDPWDGYEAPEIDAEGERRLLAYRRPQW